MITVYIDNHPYQVEEEQNLLQACLALKLDLPYFCWHPAMGSVGACRQCAMTQYQDENDTRGRLIVACMTPVTDGMRVSMQQPAEKNFRDQVISALMTHHPHDCPVCAEGGECHLQDMTVMAGHYARQFKGRKTTFPNQQLGPLIKHEMNRCITCYRCVRFYQDYAGGSDLAAQASKNHVYFGRQCDGTLESEFAGNLVEVCPTGVFTDKPFGDHYSRKWDLQAAPSVCQHCSVGCNITLSERYGSVRRVTNRLNDHINGYFLCDRGRFGFDFINSADRSEEIHMAGARTRWDDEDLKANLQAPGRWVGIGSSEASLEDNFALQQLVGKDNFCPGLNPVDEQLLMTHRDILRQHAMPSVAEIEKADAIIILAENINASAPRIALAIRQALNNNAKAAAGKLRVPSWQDAAVRQILPHHPVPLIYFGYGSSALADTANVQLVCDDKKAAEQSFLMAGLLNNKAPSPKASKVEPQSEEAVKLLSQAKRPLIITGWSAGNPALLAAAANLHKALNNQSAMLCLVPDGANVLTLGLLSEHGHYPMQRLLDDLEQQSATNFIVLDHSSAAFEQQLEAIRGKARRLIRLSQLNASPIDTVDLPIASFSECSGSQLNYQGLLQSRFPATQPAGQCLPAWQWLVHIAGLRRHPLAQINRLDQLRDWLCEQFPHLNGAWQSTAQPAPLPLAMQPPRISGRTAMLANQSVHEPKPFSEPFAPYKQSMEGIASGSDRSRPIPYSWSPGWNSNQSNHKFRDEYRGPNEDPQAGYRAIPASYEACWFKWQPAWSKGRNGDWQVLKQQRVFGSDSLSLHAIAIQQMLQPSSLTVNPRSASQLGLVAGDVVEADGYPCHFLLQVDDNVPAKSVLLYLPADQVLTTDSLKQISKVPDAKRTAFYARIEQQQAEITVHKKTQNERLLSQDTRIPIRFVGESRP